MPFKFLAADNSSIGHSVGKWLSLLIYQKLVCQKKSKKLIVCSKFYLMMLVDTLTDVVDYVLYGKLFCHTFNSTLYTGKTCPGRSQNFKTFSVPKKSTYYDGLHFVWLVLVCFLTSVRPLIRQDWSIPEYSPKNQRMSKSL